MRLDRRIQFRRATLTDNGYGMAETWADHGSQVFAKKTDVSDSERWRAGEVSASITTRFLVRHSAFTADVSPRDRLVCEGLTYDISGCKEPPNTRRRWVEITASARSDQ